MCIRDSIFAAEIDILFTSSPGFLNKSQTYRFNSFNAHANSLGLSSNHKKSVWIINLDDWTKDRLRIDKGQPPCLDRIRPCNRHKWILKVRSWPRPKQSWPSLMTQKCHVRSLIPSRPSVQDTVTWPMIKRNQYNSYQPAWSVMKPNTHYLRGQISPISNYFPRLLFFDYPIPTSIKHVFHFRTPKTSMLSLVFVFSLSKLFWHHHWNALLITE